MFDVFFLHLCVLQALEKCRDIQDEPVYDVMHNCNTFHYTHADW